MPNKIDITILDRPQPSDRLKTMVLPSRRPRKLGRRRIQGIRLYDLGRIRSGDTWIMLPYDDPLKGTTLIYNSDGTRTNSRLHTGALTPAEYNSQLYDLLWDIPAEEWRSTFRQITEDDTQHHGLDMWYRGTYYQLTTGSANWRNGIFRPNNATVTDYPNQVFWPPLGRSTMASNLPGAIKVTATNDYTAEAVSFTMTSNCDIFLVPVIEHVSVFTSRSFSPGTTGVVEALNDLTALYERDQLLDPSHEYYSLGYIDTNAAWPTTTDYVTAYNIMRYVQEYHPYRAASATRNGSVYTDVPLSVAAFAPAPPFNNGAPDMTGLSSASISLFVLGAVPSSITGLLSAVVQQNGQFYYFWTN